MSSTRPKQSQSLSFWEFVPTLTAVLAIVASFFAWQWWIGVLILLGAVCLFIVVVAMAAGDYYPSKVSDTIIALSLYLVIGGFSAFVFYYAFSFGILGIRSGVIVAVATFVLFCLSWRKTSPE